MPKPAKPDKPEKPTPRGWLMLGVGGEETGMPAGRAMHWAAALCPDAELPTVDEVRAAFPALLEVGQTADGQPVTLRALVGVDEDEPAEPATGTYRTTDGRDVPIGRPFPDTPSEA